MRWVTVPLVAVLAATEWLPPPSEISLRFCSKDYDPTVRPDDHFLGTATADTVLAGPGNTARHFGRSEPGPYYGQIIRVDRMSVHSRLFDLNPDRVVVVPWDYDLTCRSVRWGGSTVFIPAGTSGLFDVTRLRDAENWIDGLPTFDSFSPHFLGYPNSLRSPRRSPSEDLEPLSAVELFEHFEALPGPEEIDERGWAAVQPFMRVVEADPQLRRRFPLGDAYQRFLNQRPSIEARARGVPVAGTYRVTITWPAGEEEVVIRTSQGAISAWRDQSGQEVLGQSFLFWYAEDVAGLESAEWPQRSVMYIAMDSVEIDRGWTWGGNMLLEHARGLGSPELASFLARWEVVNRERGANANQSTPFRFVRAESGDVTFSGAWEVEEAVELTVRGVRVSNEAKSRPY